MKRIILFIVAITTLAPVVSAAPAKPDKADEKTVQVNGIEVVRTGDMVKFSFSLKVGKSVTPNSNSLLICPVLRNGDHQVKLTPIAVRGSRSNAEYETQAMTAAKIDAGEPYTSSNGDVLNYTATVPFENWMRGSELIFSGVSAGRSTAKNVNLGQVADNLLHAEAARREPVTRPATTPPAGTYAQTPQTPQTQTPPQTQLPPRTTPVTDPYRATPPPARGTSVADELASRFTFVENISEFEKAQNANDSHLFDYNMPLRLSADAVPQDKNEDEKMIKAMGNGAMSIRFNQGSKVIAREFGENNRMLVDLISTIRAIEASGNSKIARVVIVGFASPDGTLNENDKLSMDRAMVARDFLTSNSDINPDVITMYNGSMDWISLRRQVADSNMPEKYKILDIIDNTPVWSSTKNKGRLGELMALGESYNYMVQHFFPRLRQTGAYIKVYYQNVR
ncbi:OmpA family protein [Alistipes sp. OttesenSCG-928-B03]|nr:OmpA family protein [Alistipes sp. OttesenSCG-928-B03]